MALAEKQLADIEKFPRAGANDFTFVTVPDGVKVDIVLVVADEEEAEPGVKGVDGHDEEDADDVALLIRRGV